MPFGQGAYVVIATRISYPGHRANRVWKT